MPILHRLTEVEICHFRYVGVTIGSPVLENINVDREWTNQASSPPPDLREKYELKKKKKREIEVGIPCNLQYHVV